MTYETQLIIGITSTILMGIALIIKSIAVYKAEHTARELRKRANYYRRQARLANGQWRSLDPKVIWVGHLFDK
jgi:hypothetical protein